MHAVGEAGRSVVVDCFPDCAKQYRSSHAIVVVDVIRASTTATTAVSMGRRVYPAMSTDEAFRVAENLPDPLFVGELGGNVPYGFDLTNSPVQVAALTEIPSGAFTALHRPIILVSSSGTSLLMNSVGADAVYVACARNFTAVADRVSGRHTKVAVLGAGTRNQFRREDQIVCAWVAERLVAAGHEPETDLTKDVIERWKDANSEEFRKGRSAEYLRRSGQLHDLEFIVHHVDDLDVVPVLVDGELLRATTVSKSVRRGVAA